ncbi:MAG TPA: hypothetical protein VFZ21_30930 [Gemmatimonadaceae bacterium]|nr:hypothetical protein [Gemmatimonadaceae bacterium]
MALIQLPFQKGQDSKIEAKVAPQGLLKTLSNARMTKLSRVAKRPGAVAKGLTGQSGSAVMSASLPVQAVLPSTAGLAIAKYTDAEDRVYGFGSDSRWLTHGTLPPFEAPERLPGPAAWGGGSVTEVSSAYANGLICTVFASSTDVSAIVYDVATRTIRDMESLDSGTVIRKARVVACGNSFVACWAENTSAESIRCRSFDTTAAGGTWSALQDMTNGLTLLAAQYDFDICSYSSTQIAVAFRKSSTELSLILWTFGAGTLADSVDFTADGVGLSVLGATGENIAVAWRDASDDDVKIQTFDSTLTSVAGPTTIASTTAEGPVALLRGTSSVVHVLWTARTSGDARSWIRSVNTTSHALGTTTVVLHGMGLASKPVALTSDLAYVWGTTDADFQRNYCLCSLEFTSSSPIRGIHATLARDSALHWSDAAHLAEAPIFTLSGQSYIMWGHPRILGDTVETGAAPFVSCATALAKLRGTARLQSAFASGLRYIANSLLVCFDGLLAAEAGYSVPPQLISIADAGGGNLGDGDYQYVMTLRTYAGNNLVLSQVSDPFTVTAGGGSTQTLGIYAQAPERMTDYQRSVAGTTGSVRIDLWRTLVDEAIFYRVSVPSGLDASSGGFTDNIADATARLNPVLYTQGARGGLSGPLQNDTPPPCRSIWAGKDRVICGGLEDPSEVQWSKLFFPGEAVHFSNHRSFRARIQGRVGCVAVLDDVWTVFATDAIFIISGAGPDDTAQGGFDEPRRLSSQVGCNEWRSLVETPQGLMFQGNDGEIHLLPRGFGPVAWVGRNVSDVMASYPVVTSATLVPEEHIVAFTVTNSAGTEGRVLCYDYTQLDEQGIGLWSVDTIAGGVAHISGALWDGKLALATTSAIDVMTPGTYSDRTSTWYGVTIETHPLKPAGMFGDGRVRMVGVMAEYRGDCGCDIRIAVNDSQTFSSAHSFVDATAALGATVGDQVLRGWQIPYQKGGSYALRISETQDGSTLTEGLAFVGVALDYRPRREQGRPIPPVNR